MKILTVDDSMTARLIVKRTLEPDGHEMLEAQDGAAALTMLEKHHPVDLVVLDWNMPVMNGFECLQAIRQNAQYKDVKIVMCTTEAEKARVMEAIKAGANGYVLKPVDQAKLKDQVAKACGVKS